MKKLFLVMVMFFTVSGGLNANSINMSTMDKTKDSVQSIVIDTESKKMFLTYIYPNPANINNNKLMQMKNQINKVVCKSEKMKALIKNDYDIIVTFIYSNNVIIHDVVNSCEQ